MMPHPRLRMTALSAMLALAAIVAAACGDDGDATAEGQLRVVTDVAPITSIVENIGGDRISLRGMVPRGASSHGFEPPPSDAQALSEADLFIYNGLWLAEPLYNLTESVKRDNAPILWLGEVVLPEDEWIFDFDFPAEEGFPNPHVWLDPLRALRYAELVHEQLVMLDPDNSGAYDTNLDRFRAKTLDFDERMRAAVETIAPEHRMLLTYHDCCPYLAERYGFEVIGAVQPGDFSEPSPSEVASIIDQVRELGLPAIFGSDLFPSPVMEQIGRESGAIFVYGIEDDELPGDPGDAEHTYWGMMLENAIGIVAGLGGDTAALADFDPGPVFDGESGARY
jgi:ABC-type Zn uptake system ZnuABC Zn-binding protein ZnuA